jgi:ABC-type uncharacterized transport system substrate-binding protein
MLGRSILAAPLAADAQQAGTVHRVALIFTTSPMSEMAGPEPARPGARAFVRALRALGYVEGQNLVLERRSAEGRFERFGDIVRELVGLKCDVIVASASRIAPEARRVTTTLPIVVVVSAEPVEFGLAANLARPGGNVTGLTSDAGPEIEGKKLELLKAAVAKTTRVAVLVSRFNWERPYGQSLRAAAPALGVRLLHAESAPNDYTRAFEVIARKRADALFVGIDADLFANRHRIVDFATRRRLPLMGYSREFVEAGGLISYGVNLDDLYRRAAGYVDRILKGARPGDLPFEQPTKFELVINLKTAKALGLTIPQSVLLRADQIIE